MKRLKLLSIAILASTFGFFQLSAQAEENRDFEFVREVGHPSPKVKAFVPVPSEFRELARTQEAQLHQEMFENPFFNADWQENISIELDAAELVEITSI